MALCRQDDEGIPERFISCIQIIMLSITFLCHCRLGALQ